MMMGPFRSYKSHLEKTAADKTVEYMNAGRSYRLNLLNTFHLDYVQSYIYKIMCKIYTTL